MTRYATAVLLADRCKAAQTLGRVSAAGPTICKTPQISAKAGIVFETGAFNHSATQPSTAEPETLTILPQSYNRLQITCRHHLILGKSALKECPTNGAIRA
jgi:hypothetical protein